MSPVALESARHHFMDGLAPLPGPMAMLIGLAMLLAVLWEEMWALTQHAYVIAHEGSHALTGVSVGRKLGSVKLSMNKQGAVEGGTVTIGPKKGLGVVATGFSGYIGPSVFGLVAAKIIQLGYIQAVLWLAVILLVLLLLYTRSIRGIVSVVLAGGLVVLVLRQGEAGLETVTAYAISWFLLVSGVRVVLHHRTKAGDADILKGQTGVPRTLWFVLWLAGSAAALWMGGGLLV